MKTTGSASEREHRRPKSVRFQEVDTTSKTSSPNTVQTVATKTDHNSAPADMTPILTSRQLARHSVPTLASNIEKPNAAKQADSAAAQMSTSSSAASKNGMFSSLSAAFKSVFLADPEAAEEKEIQETLTLDAKSMWYSGTGEFHRNKGNEFFQQGKFSDAIKHYTCAIEMDEDSHVIRSNRSACYQQIGRYQEALHDARIAILKAPKWYKGYCRKAAAHVALGEYEDAQREYSTALELDANDPLVVQALAEVKMQIAREHVRTRSRGIVAALRNQIAGPDLVLSSQGLGDECMQMITDGLSSNTSLHRLWLDCNGISDTGAAALGSALIKNRSLTLLSLASNDIGDTGATALATALLHNRCLKELLLEGNRIGLRGGEALAKALEDNPNIYRIGLGQNRILANGEMLGDIDPNGAAAGDGGIGGAFRRSLRLRECEIALGAGIPWEPAGADALRGEGRDCRSCVPNTAAAAAAGGQSSLRTCTAIPSLFFGAGGGGSGNGHSGGGSESSARAGSAGRGRQGPVAVSGTSTLAQRNVRSASNGRSRRVAPNGYAKDDEEEPSVDV